MRLATAIGRIFGRVEIVLAGAELALREGEQALAAGDAMRARAAAKEVLERVPRSPLGLALLADACELGGLDAELQLTLEELAERAGQRADVWVRLGVARDRTGAPRDEVRDAFVRALAVAEPGTEARRDALLALCDLDLSHAGPGDAGADGARAELWLDRAAQNNAPDVMLRRAEARLAQGDAAGALKWLAALHEEPIDGRAALARGRALAACGSADAFAPLARALTLDTPGASEALASTLAWIPTDEATRARVRVVVDAKGEAHLARWRAAFARAEGRRDVARAALRDALAQGDASAARPLLDAALEDRDDEALGAALEALGDDDDALVRDARALRVAHAHAQRALTQGDAERALDALSGITHERALGWAEARAAALARAWAPDDAPADWPPLLARLDAHARALHDLEATADVARLSAERARPVRVAIVGEFNAGKSTFINALIGQDVAPTGVLPTTATLHHLRYAPDPIAKLLFPPAHEPPERIVPVGDLRATLKTVGDGPRRVEILLPIASLTRVEILDTPGFNAPNLASNAGTPGALHAEAARAAFEEADAAIWLLDAGQPFKRTEREMLSLARAARLPVQILVNKADRLGTGDLPKVMDAVRASLDEAGLNSYTPPIALSARLALAGKLGDPSALEKSGWAHVQRLLDEEIVARSADLKERALRRRAARIMARLGTTAARAMDAERAERDRDEARVRALRETAARVDRDAPAIVERVSAALGLGVEAWQRDQRMIVTGRDDDAAQRDPALAQYRVDRALAHLARPLETELARLLPDAPQARRLGVRSIARAAVRAFAATADPRADPLVAAMVGAALATLGEAIAASAVPSPTSGGASGRVRELRALAEALA
jgi:cellulose synthase operon protein C